MDFQHPSQPEYTLCVKAPSKNDSHVPRDQQISPQSGVNGVQSDKKFGVEPTINQDEPFKRSLDTPVSSSYTLVVVNDVPGHSSQKSNSDPDA